MRVRWTPFDLPLLVFMLTAAAGAWAAYAPGPAWEKFGLLALGGGVYYGVAWLRGRYLGWLALGLAGLGALLSLYFLLTYDWTVQAADLALLNRIGLAWMKVRPTLPGYFHPNVAGGILALLLPFALAVGWGAAATQRRGLLLAALGLGGVLLGGLIMTSSRGAWLGLGAGLGVWALWLACQWLAPRMGQTPRRLYAAAGGLLALGGLVLILTYPGGLVGLANRLPGLTDGVSRWELDVNTFHLVDDFPFTGGGLRAFEGLYSRYALVIQVPQFTYSHNFYLDVWLEQGLFGELALWALLLGSLARLALARNVDETLRWAALASLVTWMAHGLIDDALYGQAGTPLVFLLPALAAALTRKRVPAWLRPQALPGRWRWGLAGLGLAAVIALGRPLLAGLYADLGAVALARAELAGWPDQRAAEPEVGAARTWLERAVALDNAQPTARHRLGLLAERAGDYPAAAAELERAYQREPDDRGVAKTLGYVYTWLGDLERAAPLLRPLPEAPAELDTYAWWWGTQGRPDLAEQAARLRAQLAAAP